MMSTIEQEQYMTRILASCCHSYRGDPLWVTGHALRRALKVTNPISNGFFTTQEQLSPVRTYEEYFKLRILPEVLKTTHFQGFGQGMYYTFEQYHPTSLTFDIAGKIENLTIGTHFKVGGMKNQGNGCFIIIEKQCISLEELIYPKVITWAKLLTPIAKKSIPSMFQRQHLRFEEQWYYHGLKKERLTVVDGGQIFRLKESLSKKQIRKIMQDGMRRKGYRASVGLGEYYCF
jgi:hypothetical protein